MYRQVNRRLRQTRASSPGSARNRRFLRDVERLIASAVGLTLRRFQRHPATPNGALLMRFEMGSKANNAKARQKSNYQANAAGFRNSRCSQVGCESDTCRTPNRACEIAQLGTTYLTASDGIGPEQDAGRLAENGLQFRNVKPACQRVLWDKRKAYYRNKDKCGCSKRKKLRHTH